MNNSRFDTFSRSLASRSSRRRSLKTGSLGIAGAALGAVGFRRIEAQQATPILGATPVPGEKLNLLFVQNAGATTMERNADGAIILTMNTVSAQTLYFSDRPAHTAGAMPTGAFTDAWAQAFTGSPPNATLIGHPEVGGDVDEAVVVELRTPVFDESAATLTYEVRILLADEIDGRNFEQEPITSLDSPRSWSETHLFIDDGVDCASCVLAAIFSFGAAAYYCAESDVC